MNENFEHFSSFDDVIKESIEASGKVNIIVAGKTGVGKSTLINTVFRGDLAKTGSGRPVTQGTEEITKPDHPVTIFDTKGLELKDYVEIIESLQEMIKERSVYHDASKHIHVAWVCIHEDGRRVEEAERDLCKMFQNERIPVIVVITKSRSDKGFRDEVKSLIPSANAVVSVRALPEKIDDDGESIVLKEKGISDLILETRRLLPEAMRRAYSNALNSRHAATLKVQIEQAELEVNIAATAAGAAAATPIPFSDAIALIPIQVSMLAKIGITFGMKPTTTALTTLVTSVIGSSALTLAGRSLVSAALKLVPGAGSIAGGAIAATTATTLTKALGAAYISILTDFSERNPGKEMDVDLIAGELKKKLSLNIFGARPAS